MDAEVKYSCSNLKNSLLLALLTVHCTIDIFRSWTDRMTKNTMSSYFLISNILVYTFHWWTYPAGGLSNRRTNQLRFLRFCSEKYYWHFSQRVYYNDTSEKNFICKAKNENLYVNVLNPPQFSAHCFHILWSNQYHKVLALLSLVEKLQLFKSIYYLYVLTS